MALITCPDCGGAVSDAAPACIHCGRPMAPASAVPTYAAPAPAAPPFAPPPPTDPMARRAAEREQRAAAARRIAIVAYGLHFLAFLYFLPGIVALVIAYTRRNDARGTWVESHFDWQISTFWTSVWCVIGATLLAGAVMIMTDSPLVGTILLYPIALALLIWYVYRMVRGALALYDETPIA